MTFGLDNLKANKESKNDFCADKNEKPFQLFRFCQ